MAVGGKFVAGGFHSHDLSLGGHALPDCAVTLSRSCREADQSARDLRPLITVSVAFHPLVEKQGWRSQHSNHFYHPAKTPSLSRAGASPFSDTDSTTSFWSVLLT